MAFNTNTGRAEYVASAGQTEFTYVFKTFNTSDIKAYLTPVGNTPDDVADLLTETTDYTIVQNGDNGGTLTLVTPATLDDTVVLVRELPIDRQYDYQTGGDLQANTLDDDQDYQTYLVQQNNQDAGRYIKFGDTTTGVDPTVPAPNPGYFKWKDDGTGIELDDSISDSVSAAAASALAAALSETNAAISATSSQLKAWESQAERLTADSYATEPEDVFVNIFTSDGDGTFTATPTIEYSALHWAAKSMLGAKTVTPQISIAQNPVDENSTGTVITINNYDTDATYTFLTDVGTVNYTSGATATFDAKDITDGDDDVGVITCTATKPGELRSDADTIDMTITYVPIIADTAVTYNSSEFTTVNY